MVRAPAKLRHPAAAGPGEPAAPTATPRPTSPGKYPSPPYATTAITRSNHEPACACHQPSRTPQLNSKFKILAGKDNLPQPPGRQLDDLEKLT